MLFVHLFFSLLVIARFTLKFIQILNLIHNWGTELEGWKVEKCFIATLFVSPHPKVCRKNISTDQNQVQYKTQCINKDNAYIFEFSQSFQTNC